MFLGSKCLGQQGTESLPAKAQLRAAVALIEASKVGHCCPCCPREEVAEGLLQDGGRPFSMPVILALRLRQEDCMEFGISLCEGQTLCQT